MERPVTKSLLFLVLVGGGRHAIGRGRSRRNDAGCLSDKPLKGIAFLLNNLSTPQLPGSSAITVQRRMGKGSSLHVSWTAELNDFAILSPEKLKSSLKWRNACGERDVVKTWDSRLGWVVHIKTNYHPEEAYKSLQYVFFKGGNLWYRYEQQKYKIDIFEV